MAPLGPGRAPEAAEWAALLARQSRDVVYAVITTGIFCRFGCPARAPLRGNVRLFDTAGQAQAAGFRPCKRCGGWGLGDQGRQRRKLPISRSPTA